MKPAPPVIKMFFASSSGGNLAVPVSTGASLQIPVSLNCRATRAESALFFGGDDEYREDESLERREKILIPKNDLRARLHELGTVRSGWGTGENKQSANMSW
jgi:hypothetical protein